MRSLTFFLALGASCGEHEGDQPGECTDGADNDRDGFFDCDDQDCVFAPDCDEDQDDTGDSGDDTGDPEAPDARLLELTSVTLDYRLDIVFDFAVFGVDACDMVYAGTGTQRTDAAGDRVTFSGTWKKTGGTCPKDLDPIVWSTSGPAYHSFLFAEGLATLEAWHAHEKDGAWTTEDSSQPHFYVTEMESPYNHADPSVTWTLEEKVIEIYGTLKHKLDVRFQK